MTWPSSQVSDVDVVGLENAAEVGLVRDTRAQPLERRLLVPEGFKEDIRKVRAVELLLRKVANGLFYLNSVQPLVSCGSCADSAFE